VLEAFQRVDSEGLIGNGDMEIHGHPALWQATQRQDTTEQTLTVAWYCPERRTRYLAVYTTLEGKPGMPAPLVALIGQSLRCAHEGSF